MKRTQNDSYQKCPQYYKIGDEVEAIKLNIGAWFKAVVIDIYPKTRCECYGKCQCLFKILFESDDDDAVELVERKLDEIRQITYSSLEWESLKVGMKVVINYNIENPSKWGYWYDYVINDICKRDGITFLRGTLLVGYNGVTDKIPVEINSDIVSDVLEIRPHATVAEKEMDDYETGVKPVYCKSCKNKPKVKCRKCCCCKCGQKKDFQLTVLCDECADWYHIYCVNPPLTKIPDDDDDWYCPKCSNEVLREKLKKRRGAKRKAVTCSGNGKSRTSDTKNEKRINLQKNEENNMEGKGNEIKNDLKHVAKKRQTDTKPKESKAFVANKITSEIPKNSVIWNDVERLFPNYEVLHISVTLGDKSNQKVLNPTLERLIYGDESNEHLWNEARESIKYGRETFLSHVRRLFTCSICCELMNDPITLSCKHSFCIQCFFKSLSVNVYNCALCRTDVIHTEHYVVNENLASALKLLFEE